jgi:hypothetical protein
MHYTFLLEYVNEKTFTNAMLSFPNTMAIVDTEVLFHCFEVHGFLCIVDISNCS